MNETTSRSRVDDGTVDHETHVEPIDAEAEAYRWVCACGDGEDELAREVALLDSRRHERRAG